MAKVRCDPPPLVCEPMHRAVRRPARPRSTRTPKEVDNAFSPLAECAGIRGFRQSFFSDEQSHKKFAGGARRPDGDGLSGVGADQYERLHPAGAHEPLGEKLNESNGGVICPPGMSARPPDAGKTPVIPPPGNPGGNPNVQPK